MSVASCTREKSLSKLTTLYNLHTSLNKCFTNKSDIKWITQNLFFGMKIIMDVCCIMYQRKITVEIENTLQFAHVSKKINASPTNLTYNGQLRISFSVWKLYWTSAVSCTREKSQSKLTIPCNLHTFLKK